MEERRELKHEKNMALRAQVRILSSTFWVIAQWQSNGACTVKQKPMTAVRFRLTPLWRDTIFDTNLLDVCSVISLLIYTPVTQSG